MKSSIEAAFRWKPTLTFLLVATVLILLIGWLVLRGSLPLKAIADYSNLERNTIRVFLGIAVVLGIISQYRRVNWHDLHRLSGLAVVAGTTLADNIHRSTPSPPPKNFIGIVVVATRVLVEQPHHAAHRRLAEFGWLTPRTLLVIPSPYTRELWSTQLSLPQALLWKRQYPSLLLFCC